MRKYFCDRCGAEIPDGTMHWIKAREVYRRIVFFAPVGMKRDVEKQHEICQECMDSFYYWWCNVDEVQNNQKTSP